MNGKLQLAVVDSPARERKLLQELSTYHTPLASRFMPVRNNELSRVKSLAKRCNYDVVVHFEGEHKLSEQVLQQPPNLEFIPDLIVVGRELDTELKSLARLLCAQEPLDLEEATQNRGKIPSGKTALFVWSPHKTSMRTAIDAIEAVSERNYRIGFLPCFGSDDDRWSLLKALSFPIIPNRNKCRVISSNLGTATAPKCVRGYDQQVPLTLRENLDVLALEGHGNPQDLFLGRNAILCARQGSRTTESPLGVFPCFHDGICFRKAFRLPDAELIGGNELDALLLFALTCYYIHLGKSAFSQDFGLAAQISSGATLAVISSPAVVWSSSSLLVLGLAMLYSGMPLSEVAYALDQEHRHRFGFSTGLPESVPAITLFGNPCARLSPSNVTDVNLVRQDAGLSFIKSPALVPGIGAFLRVPLNALDVSTPTWNLEGLPENAWAHGARQRNGDREYLYLWIGDNDASSNGDAFTLSAVEQSELQDNTVRNYLEALDFWFLFFDYSLEVREGRQGNIAVLQQALLNLHRWQRRFTRLAVRFGRPNVSVLLNGNALTVQIFDEALAQMREFSKVLIELATDILAYDGFNDIGVYGPMLNGRTDLFSGPCACGECELQTHQWVPVSGDRPEAYRHACPCSSAGIDSFRHDVKWESAPRTINMTESLRLSVTVTSPDDSFLIIAAQAVLVRPTHDRRISGPMIDVVLAPSEQKKIACEVTVPEDIPAGLHEISLLAVINGALVQRCYMIDVQKQK